MYRLFDAILILCTIVVLVIIAFTIKRIAFPSESLDLTKSERICSKSHQQNYVYYTTIDSVTIPNYSVREVCDEYRRNK